MQHTDTAALDDLIAKARACVDNAGRDWTADAPYSVAIPADLFWAFHSALLAAELDREFAGILGVNATVVSAPGDALANCGGGK